MANYRTAMGKSVDMAALTAKNEKTRAVGNMKVNARGDTIDAQGRVTAAINVATTSSGGGTSSAKSIILNAVFGG